MSTLVIVYRRTTLLFFESNFEESPAGDPLAGLCGGYTSALLLKAVVVLPDEDICRQTNLAEIVCRTGGQMPDKFSRNRLQAKIVAEPPVQFGVKQALAFIPTKSVLKRSAWYFLTSAAALAAMMYFTYFEHKEAEVMMLAKREMAHIEEISLRIRHHAGEIALSDLVLFKYYAIEERNGLEDLDGLIDDFNGLMKARQFYHQVRILNPDGREVVVIRKKNGNFTTVPKDELEDKSSRYYYSAASKLNDGEVYISEIDLNVERMQVEKPFVPVIRIATPLFIEGKQLGCFSSKLFGKQYPS